MQLGKSFITVYWLTSKNIKVIKTCAAGDSFGYVQDIETGEVIGTYGYATLPAIGKLEVNVVKGNFIPTE